jgi:hypothetical protein
MDNGDGTFTTTLTLTVENLGNVVLSTVQVSDDLRLTFPNPATFSMANLTSGTLTVDGSFDGDGNNDLLAGTDSLAVGASATLTFDVTFDPMGLPGPFSNSATTMALSPAGTGTSDTSHNGTDPDPNMDSDPSNSGSEDAPTPITITENPVIVVAKVVGPVVDNGNGTFASTITLTIENLGNVVLQNVQVTDGLRATFPAPATFSVANVTSGTLAVNAGFDGDSDTDLLAGSDSLAVGATASITFTVTFDPMSLAGPFNNTALAQGAGPAGGMTSDTSDNGTEPEPNGNNDPGEAEDTNPTPLNNRHSQIYRLAN